MRLKRALIFAFMLLPPAAVRFVFSFPYCALKKNEKKEND